MPPVGWLLGDLLAYIQEFSEALLISMSASTHTNLNVRNGYWPSTLRRGWAKSTER